MGNGKAAGWDTIPKEELKEFPLEFLQLLLLLFNCIKDKGVITNVWSRFSLIHKKGPRT